MTYYFSPFENFQSGTENWSQSWSLLFNIFLFCKMIHWKLQYETLKYFQFIPEPISSVRIEQGDLRGQAARGSLLLRSRKLCLASKTAMAPSSRTISKPSMKRQEACLLYHICQGSHIPWSRKWRLKTRRWTGRENRHCRKTRSKASVRPNSNVYKSLWLNLKF